MANEKKMVYDELERKRRVRTREKIQKTKISYFDYTRDLFRKTFLQKTFAGEK